MIAFSPSRFFFPVTVRPLRSSSPRRRGAETWHGRHPRTRCELSAVPQPHKGDNLQDSAYDVQYSLHVLSSVTELDKKQWDSFAAFSGGSPFLRHDWFRCLEEAECATKQTGWKPHHLMLRHIETQRVVAIAPAYVKSHSMGEFVFDYEWADAAYAAGILYYPKLLLAVPFTPATARRILTAENSQQERNKLLFVFAQALVQLCDAMQVSSVHVNFCAEDEVQALQRVGFLLRKGVQYHFTNYKKGQTAIASFEAQIQQSSESCSMPQSVFASTTDKRTPYIDFEDYLSEFRSKKRIKMRRERTVVREESGLRIEVVTGQDVDQALMECMFEIYKSTVDKKFYGRQYLTKKFFQMLANCDDFKRHICLVLARSAEDGRIVGGTFNIVSDTDGGAFYGRYWGCIEEVRYLHFETCYYAAIEYCIHRGLSRMEPGAGGGDFKYMRGFEPSVTRSMHYFLDKRLASAVARYLDVEGVHIDGAVSQMRVESAIRSKASKLRRDPDQ